MLGIPAGDPKKTDARVDEGQLATLEKFKGGRAGGWAGGARRGGVLHRCMYARDLRHTFGCVWGEGAAGPHSGASTTFAGILAQTVHHAAVWLHTGSMHLMDSFA